MTGYAVSDFETTGFSPERTDRVLEVGIVLLDENHATEDEWTTLVNPGRDLGPTHVHGIRGADVRDAPTFAEIGDQVLDLMHDRVVVAHNAPFDMRFLQAELNRLGHAVDKRPPAMCTMKWSRRLLGATKLDQCCEALGIPLENAHAALNDARATAELWRRLVAAGESRWDWRDDLTTIGSFTLPHDAVTRAPRLVMRSGRGAATASVSESVIRSVTVPGVAESEESYVLTLTEALQDNLITAEEKAELVAVARESGISGARAGELNAAVLHSIALEGAYVLAREAWADGRLTMDEHAELMGLVGRMGLTQGQIDAAIREAAEEMRAKPSHTLTAGDRVVFTGQLGKDRDDWIAEIVAAGLTTGGISKATALVVAADVDSLSGKAKKARQYGIPIVDEEAFTRTFRAYASQVGATTR
jgi:DNA polymerase-3 subunit epsilon